MFIQRKASVYKESEFSQRKRIFILRGASIHKESEYSYLRMAHFWDIIYSGLELDHPLDMAHFWALLLAYPSSGLLDRVEQNHKSIFYN
jgi:hypothetical protein